MGLLLIFLILLTRHVYRSQNISARKRYMIPFLFRLGTYIIVVLLIGDLGASWTTAYLRKPLVRVFFDNSVSAAYHQSISSESLVGGYQEIASTINQSIENTPIGGQTEFYSFGSEIQPINRDQIDLQFDEPTTALSPVLSMVDNIQRNHYLAGIVIVTDGQVTMGADPKETARELNVPVYTIGIGNLTPMVDVHIEKVEAPIVGVRGDMATADVFISSIGDIKDRVHVTISRGEKLIGSKMIALSGWSSMQIVKFRFRLEEPGSDLYRVHVAAVKDEINISNNRTSFTITTLKDRFQVALITGTPSPNTSFIKRILRLGDKFETDHFVHYANGWSQPIAQFWRTPYDLIILDNAPTLSMRQRWSFDLEGKLERTPSALAFIPGPNVPEEKARTFYGLLGLQQSSIDINDDKTYPISFSEESKRHPIFGLIRILSEPFFSQMSFPPIKPFLLVEPNQSQTSAVVFLETPVSDIPLFILGYSDPSEIRKTVRTAMFTSKDLWQLHFRVMWTDYANFVEQWWQRTFNWLVMSSGEEESYFRLNKHTFQQGETIYVSGSILDLDEGYSSHAQVSMIVRDETGETKSFPLRYSTSTGRWEESFLAGIPGTYDYVIKAERKGIPKGEQTGTFRVEESQIELNRVFLNQKLLSTLSNQTGGIYTSWENRSAIQENLNFQTDSITISKTFQLSHWIPLCIIALILLIGEWITRRIFGLQ